MNRVASQSNPGDLSTAAWPSIFGMLPWGVDILCGLLLLIAGLAKVDNLKLFSKAITELLPIVGGGGVLFGRRGFRG